MSARRGFTLAILGCGAVVQEFHAAVLPTLAPGIEVKLCVDIDRGRADEVARPLGASALDGGIEELLAARPTDGVLVALPNHEHARAAIQCLAAGRHVLCEKPLVVNAAELEQLEHALLASDRLLSVNLLRRFLPATLALPAVVEELAPLVRVCAEEGGGGWPSRTGFQFVRWSACGGVTLDRGPHVFDLLIGILGVAKVDGYQDDALGGVEATSITHMSWPDGTNGVVRISKVEPWRPRVTFTAADGRAARWDLHEPTAITMLDRFGLESERRSLPSADVSGLPPMLAAQRTMLDRWVAGCRGEQPNPTPFEDVRAGCVAIESCYAVRRPLELDWQRFDA
jgi:predicted dehydrogenase